MRLVVVYAVHEDATVGSGSQAAGQGDATEKEMATASHATEPFGALSYETLVRQVLSETATPIVRRWPKTDGCYSIRGSLPISVWSHEISIP